MCHIILGIPVLGLSLFFFLPLSLALPLYLVLTALSIFVWLKVAEAMHHPVQTGLEAMPNASAVVESWEGDRGRIRWHGELWTARTQSVADFRPGEAVHIRAVEGLKAWLEDGSQPDG